MEIETAHFGDQTIIEEIFVLEDGCLYGGIDGGIIVLLNTRPGTTKLTFEEARQEDLLYIMDGAFDNAPDLNYLDLPDNCIYDFSLFDIIANAEQLFYNDTALVSAWTSSCLVATAVNEAHGAGSMAPDFPITEMAMIRANELPQSLSYNRPDGSSWADLLNEYNIDWYGGYHWVNQSAANADAMFDVITETMADLTENPYDEEGNIYTGVGCGIVADGDSYYYAWFFIN